MKGYTDPDNSDIANNTIDYCYRMNDIPKTYKGAITSEANKWTTTLSEEIRVHKLKLMNKLFFLKIRKLLNEFIQLGSMMNNLKLEIKQNIITKFKI